MTVVIAVVACLVLLVVVSLVLVVVITVLCRRHGKKNIYKDADANKSVALRVCVCVSLPCTPVDKTQSRRQSGLVCSLLVVSLLLSAVVGEEGELSG